MSKRTPAAPKGTGPSGRRLWQYVMSRFELNVDEELVLRQAMWAVDCADRLQKVVDAEKAMYDSTRAHPAINEVIKLHTDYMRLRASLRLPDDEHEERPQRRGGARGVYSAKRYGSMNLVEDMA